MVQSEKITMAHDDSNFIDCEVLIILNMLFVN